MFEYGQCRFLFGNVIIGLELINTRSISHINSWGLETRSLRNVFSEKPVWCCATSIFGGMVEGEMERWRALTVKDFWNGQMESPQSKGLLLKWTDGKPSQQRIMVSPLPDLNQTGSLPILQKGLNETGSLPILQMVWTKLAASHSSDIYFQKRRWLDAQEEIIQGNHLKKVVIMYQLCYCIIPTH